MAKAQSDGQTAPNTTVYYAPDGGEYPVDEDALTPVERTQLRSWGYTKDKPDPEVAAANTVPIPDGGPLSGAAAPPD